MKLTSALARWAVLLCALAYGGQVAQSQANFEPPSLGELIGGELSSAFDAAQRASRSKAQFNAEIREARNRYISALRAGERSGSAFEALRYEFARLLAAKDIYYLTLFVAEGVTNETIARARATDSLTGGALDNAIPEHAWKDFQVWVFEVRYRLGAGFSGSLIQVTDPDSIRAAIVDSADAYQAYTRKRDEAEFIAAGLIRPEDLPSARPGRTPPEVVALNKVLYDASLGKLQPDFKEHEFADCFLPGYGKGCDRTMRDAQGKLRDTALNRMQLATAYYHLPGVYRLEMMRSPYLSEAFEHVTGRCIIFDNPIDAIARVTLLDQGELDEFVHSGKRMICEIGARTYANSALQTSTRIEFPFGLGRPLAYDPEMFLSFVGDPYNIKVDAAGYQGPAGHNVVPLSVESDTLVGYEVRSGPTGFRDRRQVVATKLVRERDLIDLATLDLEGTYEVTLGYGAGLVEQAEQWREFESKRDGTLTDREDRSPAYFASASYALTCVIRHVGAYEALEMVCRDNDGVLITPGRGFSTHGVCRKPGGEPGTDRLSDCRRHGPDQDDFVPFTKAGWGRRGTEGHFEVFKPLIMVKEGVLREEANYFASLAEPLIIADPDAPQAPGETRLIIQWGELFGPMVRTGDPVVLNDADREWLAFYDPPPRNNAADRAPVAGAEPGVTNAQPRVGQVGPKGAVDVPAIALARTTFHPGEAIEVAVSGLPGSQTDWLTLTPDDYAASRWGQQWFYTKGQTAGSWSFSAPNTPGRYEVRVYFDYPRGGMEIRARRAIDVVPAH